MNRMHTAGLALALILGTSVAWAKLPPPPPVDEATKAAAEAKKAEAAKKSKAELDASMDVAVKNYQANMKKAGKPIPKPTPVVAAAAPAAPAKPGDKGAAPAKAPEKPAAKK